MRGLRLAPSPEDCNEVNKYEGQDKEETQREEVR